MDANDIEGERNTPNSTPDGDGQGDQQPRSEQQPDARPQGDQPPGEPVSSQSPDPTPAPPRQKTVGDFFEFLAQSITSLIGAAIKIEDVEPHARLCVIVCLILIVPSILFPFYWYISQAYQGRPVQNWQPVLAMLTAVAFGLIAYAACLSGMKTQKDQSHQRFRQDLAMIRAKIDWSPDHPSKTERRDLFAVMKNGKLSASHTGRGDQFRTLERLESCCDRGRDKIQAALDLLDAYAREYSR